MRDRFLKLFTQDQKDREGSPLKINWSKVSYRDELRRQKARVLLQKIGKSLTPQEAFHAAMIFQHGSNLKDSNLAVSLSRRAIKGHIEEAKWLFAAATDRLLMKMGKSQKFGTQSILTVKIVNNSVIKEYVMYPYEVATNDLSRRKYNVPPLKTLKLQAKKINAL